MKRILLSIAICVSCLVLTGCTSSPATVTLKPNGEIVLTSSKKFGGRQVMYAKSEVGVGVIVDENEKSFAEGNRNVVFGLGSWALVGK